MAKLSERIYVNNRGSNLKLTFYYQEKSPHFINVGRKLFETVNAEFNSLSDGNTISVDVLGKTYSVLLDDCAGQICICFKRLDDDGERVSLECFNLLTEEFRAIVDFIRRNPIQDHQQQATSSSNERQQKEVVFFYQPLTYQLVSDATGSIRDKELSFLQHHLCERSAFSEVKDGENIKYLKRPQTSISIQDLIRKTYAFLLTHEYYRLKERKDRMEGLHNVDKYCLEMIEGPSARNPFPSPCLRFPLTPEKDLLHSAHIRITLQRLLEASQIMINLFTSLSQQNSTPDSGEARASTERKITPKVDFLTCGHILKHGEIASQHFHFYEFEYEFYMVIEI